MRATRLAYQGPRHCWLVSNYRKSGHPFYEIIAFVHDCWEVGTECWLKRPPVLQIVFLVLRSFSIGFECNVWGHGGVWLRSAGPSFSVTGAGRIIVLFDPKAESNIIASPCISVH